MNRTDTKQRPERRMNLAIWRRIAGYALVYRRLVIALGFLAVATAAAEVALPLVTRRLVDDVVDHGGQVSLAPYAAVYAALTIFLAAFVLGFIRVAGRLRSHVCHDIRRDGFENLQRLSFSYFDRRPVGWLMTRMTSDCDRLSNILAWGTLDVVWGVAAMTGISAVLLVLHWQLALVVLGVVPLLAWLSWFFQKRILTTARVVRETNSRITSAYNEGITGVKTAKAFVREARDGREFAGLTGEMYSAATRNASLSALYQPLVLTLASLATGLALARGGISMSAGTLSLGTLVGFLSYARSFFDPVRELSAWFAEFQMAQASAERIIELIEAHPDVEDSAVVREALALSEDHPRPAGIAADGHADTVGRIRFAGVGFAYGDGPAVLEDFELEVQAGECIALVGPTGGGKSTVVSLLCRFYEPTQGGIFFDDLEYRERGLAWLQSNLGIVLQTPHLFSGTLAENIRYGNLEATDEQVRAAAALVEADAFVEELPDGYDTQVGEGGARLSSGQRQLISFARALLAEPRILILDEATSSIDTETEGRIQRGLERVMRGRTTFVIAHRLTTIRNADRIVFVEGGRIVESGSHTELLRSRGRYRQLYEHQSLGHTLRSPRPAPALAAHDNS